MSHRRVQKKQKATNYCVRFWSLVMVRNQLPTQVVKSIRIRLTVSLYATSPVEGHVKHDNYEYNTFINITITNKYNYRCKTNHK